MYKYRKKPIVVEARQFTGINGEELAKWCGGSVRGVKLFPSQQEIAIQTLEGEMRATFGDYIIKGVKGEFYPCKPDIFEVTYEKESNRPTPPTITQETLDKVGEALDRGGFHATARGNIKDALFITQALVLLLRRAERGVSDD